MGGRLRMGDCRHISDSPAPTPHPDFGHVTQQLESITSSQQSWLLNSLPPTERREVRPPALSPQLRGLLFLYLFFWPSLCREKLRPVHVDQSPVTQPASPRRPAPAKTHPGCLSHRAPGWFVYPTAAEGTELSVPSKRGP